MNIGPPPSWGGFDDPASDLRWAFLNEIEEVPIEWVDYPFLQRGAFHLLAGIKNSGKGTWLAHVAARFSRGEFGPNRRVVWIALGEDSYSTDVRPRVRAAAGDLTNVVALDGGDFRLPDKAQQLDDKIRELDAGVVIIDPLGGAMMGGKSTNFDADVRPVLETLNRMAAATKAVIIGVRHISIKTGARQQGTLAAILGSSEWINIPRAVLALVHDDVDANVRHLFAVTGNRGPSDEPGLMLHVEAIVLDGHQHPVTHMRAVGESNKDPDELLAVKRTRRNSRSDTARIVLLTLLQEQPGGSMESDLLDAETARRVGLAAKTIRNVRNDLRNEGLLRAVPERGEDATVERWFNAITYAGIAELDRTDNRSAPSVTTTPPLSSSLGPVTRTITESGSSSVRANHQNPPSKSRDLAPAGLDHLGHLGPDSLENTGPSAGKPNLNGGTHNGHHDPDSMPEWERNWHLKQRKDKREG